MAEANKKLADVRERVSKMMTDAQRRASEITDTAKAKAQEITDKAEVHRTKTISQVNAEVEQIRADISAQQDEATKKVNELLAGWNERHENAKKRPVRRADFEAQHTRDEAEAYASDKREAADKQAASILKQATEEADEQINERREAAKNELEGVQQRIADLQTREAQITQRVSELRAMFSTRSPVSARTACPVVNSIDGEQHESAAEAETRRNRTTRVAKLLRANRK